MSGNGTRCAAALLIDSGRVSDSPGNDLVITTGAGPKHLRLLERNGRRFLFEMDMGAPKFDEREIRYSLPLRRGPQEVTIEVTIVDVGNPQCVVFVDAFPPDWETLGAEIEGHVHFPKRTNVSFVRVLDQHTANEHI